MSQNAQQQLVLTLQQAMSPTDSVRKPAEETLKQFENSPGYLEALAGIMGTSGGEVNVRIMATICAKNVVERCWKSRSQHIRTVTDEEKQQLRTALLEPQRYDEAAPLVASQFSMLVAKVARNDWPRVWTDFFPSLLGILQSGSQLQIQRVMYTLHCVLKELASKRLMMDKKAFATMSVQLFPLIFQMWSSTSGALLEHLSQLSQLIQQQQGGLDQNAQQQLLSAAPQAELVVRMTKVLYRLLVAGLKGLSDVPQVVEYLQLVLQRAPAFHQCAVAIYSTPLRTQQGPIDPESHPLAPLAEGLGKAAHHMVKAVVNTQKADPVGFGPYMGAYLQMFAEHVQQQANKQQEAGQSDVRLHEQLRCVRKYLISSMRFLSNVASSSFYKPDYAQGLQAGQYQCGVVWKGCRQVSTSVV
jgi:hypothetical protein